VEVILFYINTFFDCAAKKSRDLSLHRRFILSML
jgi:hypothetical protein